MQHVRNCNTAKEAWDTLAEFHQKDTASSRVRILRTVMKQRADEGSKIEIHVNHLNELFQKLQSHGNKIDMEFLMCATLLGSLPCSYDNLITALETRKEEELTSSFVRSKIVEEYRQRTERDSSFSDTTALRCQHTPTTIIVNILNQRIKLCVNFLISQAIQRKLVANTHGG